MPPSAPGLQNGFEASAEIGPAPDHALHELLLSQWLFPAIVAANDVGLFEKIASGTDRLESLAADLQLYPKGVAVVCDLLCNQGFLAKISPDAYQLTPPASSYLDPGSPDYWGPILNPLRDSPQCQRLVEALRTGGSLLASGGQTFTQMWEAGEISVEAARDFTLRMHTISLPSFRHLVHSGFFDGVGSVLDIGGGSGALGVALAEAGVKLRYTLFDLLPVCHVAETYLSRLPSLEKSFQPGDFFRDPWPENQDVVFFGNIFHDWPPEVGVRLAEKAFASLAPGGRICLHEMILDEDKTSPRVPVLFSLLMFINHSSQQFTERELFEILQSTGFRNPVRRPNFGYYSVVTAEK
jgi:SAM-dependent methyltransferase